MHTTRVAINRLTKTHRCILIIMYSLMADKPTEIQAHRDTGAYKKMICYSPACNTCVYVCACVRVCVLGVVWWFFHVQQPMSCVFSASRRTALYA